MRSKSGRDITPGLSEGDAVSEMVREFIASSAVALFSKTYCPFCQRVKRLFAQMGIEYEAIELDRSADGAAIQAVLLQTTKQRTVPSVFVHGRHIGGNDDTQAKAASGELQKLLAQGADGPSP